MVKYEGEDLKIGFNPQYLIDILTAVTADNVEIYFGDANIPTLIKEVDNPHAVFVVMPIKV